MKTDPFVVSQAKDNVGNTAYVLVSTGSSGNTMKCSATIETLVRHAGWGGKVCRCTSLYMHILIHVLIHILILILILILIHTCAHTCTHAYTYTYTYTYMCSYIYPYMYSYIHTCIYSYIYL